MTEDQFADVLVNLGFKVEQSFDRRPVGYLNHAILSTHGGIFFVSYSEKLDMVHWLHLPRTKECNELVGVPLEMFLNEFRPVIGTPNAEYNRFLTMWKNLSAIRGDLSATWGDLSATIGDL
jgi:hypothetical protein